VIPITTAIRARKRNMGRFSSKLHFEMGCAVSPSSLQGVFWVAFKMQVSLVRTHSYSFTTIVELNKIGACPLERISKTIFRT
jgi:hypothetical protein